MKFFADTASLEEIENCFSKGVDDGITTNPKIMEDTGDLSKGFIEACKNLVNKYPHVPVSLETDLRGINMEKFEEQEDSKIKNILLEQAYELKSLGSNIIVKIPMCMGGLMAAEELKKQDIKTNITACISPYQALLATKYGKGYVSMFANRMLDSHILEMSGYNLEEVLKKSDWKDIAKQNKDKYFDAAWEMTLKEIAYVANKTKQTECELIIGSIRSPEDIYKIASASPQVITIPSKIVKNLGKIEELKNLGRKFGNTISLSNTINHPMTLYTLKEFENSANAYRNN
ncbi:hypothetical protein KAI04_02135 [Candidatus Pacearchaeota archaeon]|nr:hypothetical protein [Candidatus Pacearchaeota archaeon]